MAGGGGPEPDTLRAASHERWEQAAQGWRERRSEIAELGMPVAAALIDAVEPQPGDRLLELAAGTCEVGLLAAELVRPGGTLLCSDFSAAMLDGARARAAELGVDNAQFAELSLEWIDLEAATVDAVLCRWGLMFAVDLEAAVREMRRVLAVGGRLALATWAPAQDNPWSGLIRETLEARGLAQPPAPGTPDMFRLCDGSELAALLEGAGFGEVRVAPVAFAQRHASVDAWVDHTAALSCALGDALARAGARERADLREALHEAARPYCLPGGQVEFPALSLVASARA